MADDYKEVVAFVTKRDGGKRAIRCGRAKMDANGEGAIWLDTIPTHPSWDGSFKIATPREQGSGGGGGQRAPQPSRGGHGDLDDLPF